MSKKKKIFVAGYLDGRILPSELTEGVVDYSEDVDIYSLEEVLELGFVKPVKDWFADENNTKKEFDDLSAKKQINLILEYTQDDEIASLEVFKTEAEAIKRKEEILEFRREIDKMIELGKLEYDGPYQNNYGVFNKEYVFNIEIED